MNQENGRNAPGEDESHGASRRDSPFSDPVSSEEYSGLERDRQNLLGAAQKAKDADKRFHMEHGASETQGQWLRYAGLGVQMLVMMLLPAAGGYWLDSAQGTGPFGLIIGLMLGIGLGMYSVIAFVSRSEKPRS